MSRGVRRRGRDGRFVADGDLRTRYEQIADVLRAADPDHPERVSTRRFDAARALAGHPALARASAHSDWFGMSWDETREVALNSARDPVRTRASRHRSPPRPWSDRKGVVLALRRVAQALEQDHLAGTSYDEYRKNAHPATRELLPTSAQIVRLFGSWDNALAATGLLPEITPQPSGYPIVEATGLFVRTQGWLPARRDLEAFAADDRWAFPLQSPSQKPWAAWMDDFERWWVDELRNIMPEPCSGRSKFVPLTEEDIVALPTSTRAPKGHWTRTRVVERVAGYLVGNPEVTALQQAPYRAWAKQQNASGIRTPSASTLNTHGTLEELERDARRVIRERDFAREPMT